MVLKVINRFVEVASCPVVQNVSLSLVALQQVGLNISNLKKFQDLNERLLVSARVKDCPFFSCPCKNKLANFVGILGFYNLEEKLVVFMLSTQLNYVSHLRANLSNFCLALTDH